MWQRAFKLFTIAYSLSILTFIFSNLFWFQWDANFIANHNQNRLMLIFQSIPGKFWNQLKSTKRLKNWIWKMHQLQTTINLPLLKQVLGSMKKSQQTTIQSPFTTIIDKMKLLEYLYYSENRLMWSLWSRPKVLTLTERWFLLSNL